MSVRKFQALIITYMFMVLCAVIAGTWLVLAQTRVIHLDDLKSVSTPVEVSLLAALVAVSGWFFIQERSLPRELFIAWRKADKVTRAAYAKPMVFVGVWIGSVAMLHTWSFIQELLGSPPLPDNWVASVIFATWMAIAMTFEIKTPSPQTAKAVKASAVLQRKRGGRGAGPQRSVIPARRDYRTVGTGGHQVFSKQPRRW